MRRYRVSAMAALSIDEINDYTATTWGEAQAAAYTSELFDEFTRIAARSVPWRPLSKTMGVAGFRRNWRSHVIYWRVLPDGAVGIADVLHQSMDQPDRARSALSEEDY